MSLSLLPSQKTILMVSDDALFVYSMTQKGMRLVDTVPWDAADFEQNVASVIAQECGGKSVIILNDMVEQHYRKERVMKAGVGAMDRGAMLKRKLNVAFPNYPMRAAYPLKEKVAKIDNKSAADIYIFAAIPNTKQFLKVIGAVQKSLAPVSGFGLLPVESTDMVRALSKKLAKKGAPQAKWVVFIGQHKGGGLRQVVIKGDDLALTRMTPISDTQSDVLAWTTEVQQEFKATMSYLSRFGYQPEDGLDVILIGNKEAGSSFEAMLDQPCNFYALSVSDAASALGLNIGPQDDNRHADLLHAAWVAKKSKMLLPMKAQQLDTVSRPRQAAAAGAFILFVGAAFLAYQLFNVFTDMSSVYTDLDDAQKRASQLNSQFQREVKRKEDLGFEIRLVQSSIAVVDEFEKKNILVLQVMNGIGQALGKDMRVDRVLLSRPGGGVIAPVSINIDGSEEAKSPLFLGALQLTYPSTTNIDKGNQEVNDLRDRLVKTLPDHKVEVTKLLKDYEYVEEIVVETGDLEKENLKQDFIAEIKIEGPSEND